MASQPRVLCIDSSELRLHQIACTLRKAGFNVWTAEGPTHALCLATVRKFDVLVADRQSVLEREEIWQCLADTLPDLPLLVHPGVSQVIDLCAGDTSDRMFRFVNPEVVLAMITLLLSREDKRVQLRPSSAA